MKKYAQNWQAGILFFWFLIFAYLVVPQEIHVTYPKEFPRVVFQAYPVDPRDLFRGDYVVLNYSFSRPDIAAETLSDEFINELEDILNTSTSGDKVYLLLEVDEEGNALPIGYDRKKPEDDALFLKGKIYADYRGRNAEVLFGIERYYVPEGTGRELERARNRGKLKVEVAIHPKKGKSLITNVFIDTKDSLPEEDDEWTVSDFLPEEGQHYTFGADGTYSIPSGYDFLTTTTPQNFRRNDEEDDFSETYAFVHGDDGSTILFKKGGEIIEAIPMESFFQDLPLNEEEKTIADEQIVFSYSGKNIRFELLFTNISADVYRNEFATVVDVRAFDGMVFYSLKEDVPEQEPL
jgi:uncharacterized membrane-anchored protein